MKIKQTFDEHQSWQAKDHEKEKKTILKTTNRLFDIEWLTYNLIYLFFFVLINRLYE